MKRFNVSNGKILKSVEALHARSAANKAFPLGYGLRWEELDPDNAWAGVQTQLVVSWGAVKWRFIIEENG